MGEFRTVDDRSIDISHDAEGELQINGTRITNAVRTAQGVVLHCGPEQYLVAADVYRAMLLLPVEPPPDPAPVVIVARCKRCGAPFDVTDPDWHWDSAGWQHYHF
ncbi:MAG: hypothetical protein H0X37_16570 [Herpetosiphonaceae bacterium]|nr:hypothetical protein [Herpetosiphonaceae bacterium]